MPDYNKQILERIVGTKGKGELADKFKLAFAKKFKVKQEDMKKGKITRIFANSMKERLISRVLLQKFIKEDA